MLNLEAPPIGKFNEQAVVLSLPLSPFILNGVSIYSQKENSPRVDDITEKKAAENSVIEEIIIKNRSQR